MRFLGLSHSWPRLRVLGLKSMALGLALLSLWWYSPTALASLNDDHYDGNIFALYAGNGSLVPPKVTLASSLRQQKPALLVFYVNDSSDCKQFVTVVSQLQSFYGRVSDFIPIDVDALPLQSSYAASELGYYYQGAVPQTVLINQAGQVVLNAKGNVDFEQIDDAFRQTFDLLPRSESKELKRRFLNEVNTELSR
ncbi:MAG: thylakoid membrane photosystem I accumulation factor [Aphanocapsa sp. GSE-SYN-MK-11-07L]|nr:thylakoid membrane photosystem I accumulation factor [Aphanocapsa sp. GSE-SYN-MK-11-07L]